MDGESRLYRILTIIEKNNITRQCGSPGIILGWITVSIYYIWDVSCAETPI